MNRIFVLIGIINQLVTTRANRMLRALDLPMAQFSLLLHFSHHPQKGETVTQLAEAFEVNQPAMTKTTQRLLKKECLKMHTDQTDKRKKYLYITKKGLNLLELAWGKMEPEIKSLMKDWDVKDLMQLESLLEKFKIQLDENRDQY